MMLVENCWALALEGFLQLFIEIVASPGMFVQNMLINAHKLKRKEDFFGCISKSHSLFLFKKVLIHTLAK